MGKHFDLSDQKFEKQLINCELNPSDFTHEAHLRLACIYIDRYGIEEAVKNMPIHLQKFVEFLGSRNKYNMTLTIAAIKAVYHFRLKSKSDNFKDFIIEFPLLKTNFKDLMSCHYGFDIYNSERAKIEFIEPDLVAFD